MTLKSECFKQLARDILDKFTIDPDAKMTNGVTASERMQSYILAAIDNIERELE
jgi:hypothetical protein